MRRNAMGRWKYEKQDELEANGYVLLSEMYDGYAQGWRDRLKQNGFDAYLMRTWSDCSLRAYEVWARGDGVEEWAEQHEDEFDKEIFESFSQRGASVRKRAYGGRGVTDQEFDALERYLMEQYGAAHGAMLESAQRGLEYEEAYFEGEANAYSEILTYIDINFA